MEIHHGNCLDVLRGMPSESIDSIVTDPPYGLSFMGKKWDYDVPSEEVWRECLRVLKPGGHLLAFAGTRTQHRMAVRIEDAGFEIRDMIAWVYGSGFPKSKNLDGDWQGWGTALKPALEPITVARKPLAGTVAENVLQWGTGGLNVDGCRVGTEAVTINTWNDGAKPFGGGAGHEYTGRTVVGRWPANLIHDGSEEVVGLFPRTGLSKGTAQFKTHTTYQWSKSHADATTEPQHGMEIGYGDSGSAARFFYCAKASKADRDEGCEELAAKNRADQSAWVRKCNVCGDTFCDPATSKPHCGHDDFGWVEPSPRRNHHPTVKPTDLMRHLCRLVTPPGGVVLDPFTGSGSTGKAALLEGFRFVGIEREAEYVEIARARIVAVQPRLL